MLSVLVFTHYSDTSRLGARIELEAYRLHLAADAVLEPDGERVAPMHNGSPALQQQARPLFRARHQRLLVLVQNEHGHQKNLLTELVTRDTCDQASRLPSP